MNRLFAIGLILLSPISVANSTVSTEDVLARVNAIRAKLNGEQLTLHNLSIYLLLIILQIP